ncbi:DUF3221 domain-containing protein [Saccharibacillus kuerlensis]|uniref:Lipoprotein n=1 Tax=Saccharibacillus kuerlensis TaxID=459527 RepID=A0ABQ2KWC7_9BACL|nr:DUF3221 domain-containing protein [Saccharibacillus kuerlensis]GGN95348.1 hypothetical protein GCM10010969_11030 [Saccharibacillus kuerlensis]
MKFFRIAAAAALILTAGCSSNSNEEVDQKTHTSNQNTGIVAEKLDGRILLVESASRSDLLEGNTEKMLAENHSNAVWLQLPEEDYNVLHKGDLIEFSGTGVINYSSPAQAEASDVTLLTAANWTEEEIMQIEDESSFSKVVVKFSPLSDKALAAAPLDTHFRGGTGYTGMFTASGEQNAELTIFLKNVSSSEVYVQLRRKYIGLVPLAEDYLLKGKSGCSITITNEKGTPLTGEFKLYIYNKNGAKYDLYVGSDTLPG